MRAHGNIRRSPNRSLIAPNRCLVQFLNRVSKVGYVCFYFACATGLPCGAAADPVLRIASQADVSSLDPHSFLDTFTQSVLAAIYEPLVRMGPKLNPEPGLAEFYERVRPNAWRFRIRNNAVFPDGSAVSAGDVVFSINRVQSQRSPLRGLFNSINRVNKIDDRTIEIETAGPDLALDRVLTLLFIMSERWAIAHGSATPADVRRRERHHASDHAFGSGPFKVIAFNPNSEIILERNPSWWGNARGNVQRIVIRPIANDGSRTAAFLAGDAHIIDAVPPHDLTRLKEAPSRRIVQNEDLRTIFLGANQRAHTPRMEKNPLADRQVRKALSYAIDREAITSKLMRGAASQAGSLIGPGVVGYDLGLDSPPKYDPNRARGLLDQAGFPQGFEVTLHCTNDRYVMDEQICAAIASMLARIGVRCNVIVQNRNRHFASLQAGEIQLYLLGFTPATADALYSLNALVISPGGDKGIVNFGGYSNSLVDHLVNGAQQEQDPVAREGLLKLAQRIHQEDEGHIVLHRQWIIWGLADGVEATISPDGLMRLETIRFH
jgi:peptide/nickel transport system substrate-binding protein